MSQKNVTHEVNASSPMALKYEAETQKLVLEFYYLTAKGNRQTVRNIFEGDQISEVCSLFQAFETQREKLDLPRAKPQTLQ